MSNPQSGDSRESLSSSGHSVGIYDNTVRTPTGSVATSWSGKRLVVENGVVKESSS
jgi:hypothetical protein